MRKLFLIIIIPIFFFSGLFLLRSNKLVNNSFEHYAPFMVVYNNSDLHKSFIDYLEWIVSMDGKGSDANYVLEEIFSDYITLDGLSVAMHEKTEFLHWLELSHDLKDIMKVDYYKKYYLSVYPVAHRRAMASELSLIKYFAKTHLIPVAPELAYMLVNPMREKRKREEKLVPLRGMAIRIAFNLEYQIESVSKKDLENAIKTFELGGYRYENKKQIITEASSFKCNSACWSNYLKRYQRAKYVLNKNLYSSHLE